MLGRIASEPAPNYSEKPNQECQLGWNSPARNSYRSYLAASGMLVRQEVREPSRFRVHELVLRALLPPAAEGLRLATVERNQQIPRIPKFDQFRNCRSSVSLVADLMHATDSKQLSFFNHRYFLTGLGGRCVFSENIFHKGCWHAEVSKKLLLHLIHRNLVVLRYMLHGSIVVSFVLPRHCRAPPRLSDEARIASVCFQKESSLRPLSEHVFDPRPFGGR